MTVPSRAVSPRLLHLITADPVPDTDLLSRFIQSRDGAAFTALVERHGPMVLRVCRRMLWDAHTAEDAFQATFLALIRGARRVRKTASVAAWLYGAAVRISLKARGAAARPRRVPAPSPTQCGPDPLAEITGRELVSAIDEELARLPDRFRAAITLCCLEGLSQDEAARRLGWSAASVRGRLERGRERLRLRLAQRGLALSAGLGSLLLGEAHATIPPRLLARAIEFATRGTGPPRVAELAAGATPSGAAWKAVAVAFVVLAVGGVAAIGRGNPPQAPTQHPPEIATASTTPLDPLSGARLEGGVRRPAADPPAKTDRYGDPLPAGAIMRLGTLRTRAPITGFGIEKDGTVVTVGPGVDVRRWHAADDRSDEPAALPLTGPATSNNEPQVSLDGKLVAACSSDKVFVWETPADTKAKPKHVATFDLAHPRLFRFAPDSQTLAVVTEARNMVPAGAFLCDLKTRTAAAIDTGGVRYFEGIAFSGDGKRLGAVADSNFILWDATTGKQLAKYQTSGRVSRAFALNHAGDTLAATYGYVGKTEFRFTDPETGKKKDGLTGPDGGIYWLTYAADGKTLLTGDLGGVRWWDPTAGKLVRRYEGVAHGHALQEVPARFTPDGKALVFQNGSALLRWSAETGKLLFPEQDIGHGAAVNGVGVSPDGTRIATRGMDSRLCVWDAATGKRLWHAPAEWTNVSDIDFGPDGTFLVVGGPKWGEVTKCDAATGQALLTFAVDPKGPKQAGVLSARVSSDGKTVAAHTGPVTVGDPSFVTTWNATTGERLKSAPLSGRNPHDFSALSPDGQYLAGGFLDSRAVAVVAPDRDLLADAKLPGSSIQPGRFSADGQWLALVTTERAGGAQKYSAVLVSTTTWRAASTIPLAADFRARAAVAPDGRTLAVALGDAVEFYDAATQKLLGRHRAPPGGWEKSRSGTISALSFTPDGTKLITGHADTTALVWPVPPRPAK